MLVPPRGKHCISDIILGNNYKYTLGLDWEKARMRKLSEPGMVPKAPFTHSGCEMPPSLRIFQKCQSMVITKRPGRKITCHAYTLSTAKSPTSTGPNRRVATSGPTRGTLSVRFLATVHAHKPLSSQTSR